MTGWYERFWQLCFDAGIPVVQDIYRIRGQSNLLVPDLKADGSELYGKAFHTTLTTPNIPTTRRRPAVDRIFLELMNDDAFLREIDEKLITYADMATRAGMFLPYDDTFELKLNPNRSQSLVLLDVAECAINFNRIQDDNVYLARKLLGHLNGIRVQLEAKTAL